MRTAEDDLVPKPRMQWIGLAWFCRLTRKPQRLARRYLVPGLRNSLPALSAPLISYPGLC
jgi:N-acetylglucosaminyldiphosphoundecaprenol N-acetyl-beta-D-mannosaminyltransferase